jgi:7-alpha-hydroxysteroid dehydrogenase
VVVAARTKSTLDDTVRQIEQTGRNGFAAVTDVMIEDDLTNLVDTTVEQFGRLDTLVNNAGGTAPLPAMDTSSEYFSTALHFNATAPFVLSRLAAQAMVDTDGAGSIVNISSRSGDMVMTATVTEQLLFNHFGSKQQLFTTAVVPRRRPPAMP